MAMPFELVRQGKFALGFLLAAACGDATEVHPEATTLNDSAAGAPHEVWLVDQSNSEGLSYGGKLYIYAADELRRNAVAAAPEIVDLGADTADLCLAQTGARPVRPHMLVFNVNGNTHAILSFVASGHVVVLDAARRLPLFCARTAPGVGGARQAHAIWPTPDDAYILVANQNGKQLERIASDYAGEVFVQQPTATLDLAGCITPNGLPCEDPTLRPDNAPICPFVPASGYPAYISLRGGGMFAVDPHATPMRIVAEYDAQSVPRDGCGFVEAKGFVYGNGGGGHALHRDGWFIYRVPVGGSDLYSASNPPNTPPAQEIDRETSAPRDAHGVARTKNEKYVWFFDRAANRAKVFGAVTGSHVETLDLVTPGVSSDPTPDLAAEAPDGKALYVSLRGPNPLSGDPHASTGSTPGLLVIDVQGDGRSGVVRGLARISNIDSTGVERADAHAIRVRNLR